MNSTCGACSPDSDKQTSSRSGSKRSSTSRLLNVNREKYVSNQGLISALADTLLGMDAADDFESIPAAC